MSLVLKFSKCRLCLKLGDFYSIFASDNSIQLSNMAMACSEIKVYEGDGLPDKICGECIEKLSSAYIFKQQCERSDAELRKSLPADSSYSRRNSDSGYSNRTDSSISKKDTSQSSISGKKSNKPSDKSISPEGALLRESFSVDIQEDPMYEGNPSRQLRNNSNSRSNSPAVNDLARLQCQKCKRTYQNAKTLRNHICKVYSDNNDTAEEDQDDRSSQSSLRIVKSESISTAGKPSEMSCDKCGQHFKFNIMLKRHQAVCQKPQSPVPDMSPRKRRIKFLGSVVPMGTVVCPVCKKTFKKRLYVLKHLRMTSCKNGLRKLNSSQKAKAEGRKAASEESLKSFQAECSVCSARFSSHFLMFKHFQMCYKRRGNGKIVCKTCNITYCSAPSLLRHIKKHHKDKKNPSGLITPKVEDSPALVDAPTNSAHLKCRECDKTFSDQNELVMHLAAHMANIQQPKKLTLTDTLSNNKREIECPECLKKFSYRRCLISHMVDRHNYSDQDMKEFITKDSVQCDLCERTFKSAKNLKLHKIHAHSKPLRPSSQLIVMAKIPMTCLLCDVVVPGPDIRNHNLMHITKNEKPRNQYDCPECQESFINKTMFSAHISHHNKSTYDSQDETQYYDSEMGDESGHQEDAFQEDGDDDNEINAMDFCESVVANIKQEKDVDAEAGSDNETVNVISSCQPTPPSYCHAFPPQQQTQKLVVSLGGFTCAVCHVNVDTYSEYKEHMKHHRENDKGEPGFKCPICDEEFKFESQHKRHLKNHLDQAENDASILACRECGRFNKNYRAFVAHKAWHDSMKDLTCHICVRQFTTRTSLVTHFRRSHSSKNQILDPIADEEQSSEATPFQCHICNKYMKTAVSLNCHVQWHRSKSALSLKRYQCSQCSLAFTNKVRLVLHCRSHHQKATQFQCKVCGQYLASQQKLGFHERAHTFGKQRKLKKLKCPVCEQLFLTSAKLQGHIKRHHPEKIMVKKKDPGEEDLPKIRHICKVCGKEFNSSETLKIHGERHLRKPVFLICSLCGKRNLSRKLHTLHIKSHMCQSFKENPLQCKHCDKQFVRRNHLHVHMYEAHDILETYTLKADDRKKLDNSKEYQCHVCFKVLAKESTFLKHLDYHNAMRCNYCLKYFNSKLFMDAHVNYDCDRKKILNGGDSFEKKLKCPHCYKAFSLGVKLRCHMRTQHNKELETVVVQRDEQATCDFCFVTFDSKADMEKHARSHSRVINVWGCKMCPKRFSTVKLFYKHITSHLNRHYTDNPLKCDHCDEYFIFFKDYTDHLKAAHDEECDIMIPPTGFTEGECDICKKVFPRVHNHLKYHERCRCQKCKEYFTADYLLESHICPVESEDEGDTAGETKPSPQPRPTSNTVLEPYEECDYCYKPYMTSYTKQMHITTHAKLLQFACLYCDKTFTSITSFKLHSPSHRLRHYKDHPLLCKHCGETFVKYGLYLKHLQDAHNEKESMILRPTYPEETCKICHKVYKNIHFHYRAHKQLQCTTCHKYILSERLFKSHVCNDPNQDKSLVIEYHGEDITPLMEGKFDYSKLRHRPLTNTDDSVVTPSPSELSVIDISENELSNCAPDSANQSDITNEDVMVSMPDSNLFSSFKPVISSTVSLSEDVIMEDDFIPTVDLDEDSVENSVNEKETPEEVLKIDDVDLVGDCSDLPSRMDITDSVESSKEIQKIVDDLENSYPSNETT